MSVCLGERKSVDAITYLVQKKHSSYDEEHKSWLFFQKSLELLSLNYEKLDAVDVLIFHEGDVSEEDFTLLQGLGASNRAQPSPSRGQITLQRRLTPRLQPG